jgi:hypothetical protein
MRPLPIETSGEAVGLVAEGSGGAVSAAGGGQG